MPPEQSSQLPQTLEETTILFLPVWMPAIPIFGDAVEFHIPHTLRLDS